MRLLVHLVALTIAFGAAASAAAADVRDHNRFRWRDAQGNLHYADALPPEASALGYDIVNPQGIVVKHVDRAKTAAELAEAKAQAARDQAQRRIAEQRARDDEQLLSNYPEEGDLEHAQQLQYEMLDQQVKAAAASLRNQEQSLADLLDRAAEAERTGKELPTDQATQLAAMRKQVDEQRLTVTARERERDGAQSHFAEEVAHYRELKAKRKEGANQP